MAQSESDGWRATIAEKRKYVVSTAIRKVLALHSNQKDLGDGRNPCSYCEKHDQRCETTAERRSKDNSLDAQATARRLARLETILQNSIDKTPNTVNPQVSARLDRQSLDNGENISSQFLVSSIPYPSQPIPDHNVESTLMTTSILNRGNNDSNPPQHQGTAFQRPLRACFRLFAHSQISRQCSLLLAASVCCQ